MFFFFKQKTAYEMRISDWSSDVCSSDLALVVGQNGLTAGAQDPGNVSQSTTPPTPATVDFNNQADVLIECQSAARVAGGTVMDRPEWITVAPEIGRHTSELQSLMRLSYAVFCLKKQTLNHKRKINGASTMKK